MTTIVCFIVIILLVPAIFLLLVILYGYGAPSHIVARVSGTVVELRTTHVLIHERFTPVVKEGWLSDIRDRSSTIMPVDGIGERAGVENVVTIGLVKRYPMVSAEDENGQRLPPPQEERCVFDTYAWKSIDHVRVQTRGHESLTSEPFEVGVHERVAHHMNYQMVVSYRSEGQSGTGGHADAGELLTGEIWLDRDRYARFEEGQEVRLSINRQGGVALLSAENSPYA